jgi:hypothetical protein
MPSGRSAAKFAAALLARANARGNWDRGRTAVGQSASMRTSMHRCQSPQTPKCPYLGQPEDYQRERNRRSWQKRSTLQPQASSRERRLRRAHKGNAPSGSARGIGTYAYTRDITRDKRQDGVANALSINRAYTTVNKFLWVSTANPIQSPEFLSDRDRSWFPFRCKSAVHSVTT